jgi:hypothetical protein
MFKQTIMSILVVISLVIVSFAIERSLSPSFQACLGQPTSEAGTSGTTVRNYLYYSGNYLKDNSAGITALATLIVAVFTATLWVATHRQAVLTRDALVANNRAFVAVPNFRQFWEYDQTTGYYNWRLRPMLRNSGNTPTKDMTMFVECEIRNTPLPAGYAFASDPQNTHNGVLPPHLELNGGVVPRSPGAPITPQDIIDAQKGRRHIYLWG